MAACLSLSGAQLENSRTEALGCIAEYVQLLIQIKAGTLGSIHAPTVLSNHLISDHNIYSDALEILRGRSQLS